MPTCQNCGAFVTKTYARVFTPDGVDNPRCCPECEDAIRDGADVRETRASRDNRTEPTRYDEEKDPTVAADGGVSDD